MQVKLAKKSQNRALYGVKEHIYFVIVLALNFVTVISSKHMYGIIELTELLEWGCNMGKDLIPKLILSVEGTNMNS